MMKELAYWRLYAETPGIYCVCRSAHVFPLINPYNVVMVMHGMHTHWNKFYLERRKINTNIHIYIAGMYVEVKQSSVSSFLKYICVLV